MPHNRTLVVSTALAVAIFIAALLTPRLTRRLLFDRGTTWQKYTLSGAVGVLTAAVVGVLLGVLTISSGLPAGWAGPAAILIMVAAGCVTARRLGPYTVDARLTRQVLDRTFTAADGTQQWIQREWGDDTDPVRVRAGHGCFLGSIQLIRNGHRTYDILAARYLPLRPGLRIDNTTGYLVALHGRLTDQALQHIIAFIDSHPPQPSTPADAHR
ncbi:hypothetical protein ACWDUL_20980 [Nocardia niigatensis]